MRSIPKFDGLFTGTGQNFPESRCPVQDGFYSPSKNLWSRPSRLEIASMNATRAMTVFMPPPLTVWLGATLGADTTPGQWA